MAYQKKKNRLASGNYRVQVLDYTDENGKRHYQSFTASSKREAQAMANEWKYNRKHQKERMTVAAAVEQYIELKRNVLSPSTIRGYEFMYRHVAESMLGRTPLRDVETSDLQRFVSVMSPDHSKKYVKNVYGLVSAALNTYSPGINLRVTFPQAQRTELYTPSKADVQTLLDNCSTTELKLAILFAAVGFMRRGEACAVRFEDINRKRGTITISGSVVYDSDNILHLKVPKTYDSYRTVAMPEYIFQMIDSLGRNTGSILNMTPDQLYSRFKRALEKSGLPHFRYHDLRHHAASYAHNLGISDRYTERMGGWKPNSSVLKRVYENVIDVEMVKAQQLFMQQQQYSV